MLSYSLIFNKRLCINVNLEIILKLLNQRFSNSAALCLRMTKCLHEGQSTQVIPESKHCIHFSTVFNYEMFFVSKKTIIDETENQEQYIDDITERKKT